MAQADMASKHVEQPEYIVDWDAPPAGSYPPPVPPGTYEFLFHLAEGGAFGNQDIKDQSGHVIGVYPQVTFVAELLASVNDDGGVVPVPPTPYGDQPTVRYQRASLYRSERMRMSRGAELILCLDLAEAVKAITGGPITREAFQHVLKQADGKARGIAGFVWRAYFRDTQTAVSTLPRSTGRYRELAWPRKADGSFEDMAVDPRTGDKRYGRLEISRFRFKRS